MRSPKSFARGAEKIAFQRFLRRESDGVKEKIEAIGLALNFFKKGGDLAIARDVAGIKGRISAELADEFLDVFFQAFALVIENQARARRGPRFRDRPGDAAFIGDAEDDTGFPCENLICHNERTLAALGPRERSLSLGMPGRFFSFSVRLRLANSEP